MSEDKTDAWMPLWIGAYLADTMRLTTVQHGAYLLMLMAYWRDRKALPDVDDDLRSITKTERAEWKKMRPVMAQFFTVGNGVWWHKRVEKEMKSADERQAAASKKAKAGAEARWGKAGKQPPGNAPSMLQALPDDMPGQCPTSHTITITSTPTDVVNPDFSNTHNRACVSDPGSVCKAMKALGISDVNPGHADLTMLLAAGANLLEFEGAARQSVSRQKGFSYALGIVKKSRIDAAEAAKNMHQGAMPMTQKTAGKHTGFSELNYREGIAEDGTIA